ncbi:MAG: hypothetical protein KGD64_11105 [Candidatus Heimdallarchaeota archaeon]|nr:hypothetical protein [Candidatus Heimdallarchaeota archaeon]
MYPVEKFTNLPKHQALIDKAVEVLKEDPRVKGIYISGSKKADEFSDIDCGILCTKEDFDSLKKNRLVTAKKIGAIKAESMSGFPSVYVVFYEQDEIKFDFSWEILPKEIRPDYAYVTNLYDPEGHIAAMIEKAWKLDWDINEAELGHYIKHFHIGISYTVLKLARGELWDAYDCVDYYRKYLVKFEDMLAQRKPENYRRLEQKLNEKQIKLLEKAIPKDLSKIELFRAMDIIFEYFDTFLKERIRILNLYPDKDAKNMLEYYHRKKKEILDLI